ncbi:hypothetical protein [Fontivita pretiosa]|uniref:hypothetical protein n=1 Tax=Fontivita pretiosa TaxID=2989684 RepID=UPI003D16A075
MPATAATARLFINGKDVGQVLVKSAADSWGFGEFSPSEGFSEFAALFGNWSLLMHADDDEKRLSEAASQELRAVETALDALQYRLYLHAERQWVDLSQVNIDGSLIEWKVSRRPASPPGERPAGEF